MSAPEVECAGYDFVVVWQDGRRTCHNGDPQSVPGLGDAWSTSADGRTVTQTDGMPPAPGSN